MKNKFVLFCAIFLCFLQETNSQELVKTKSNCFLYDFYDKKNISIPEKTLVTMQVEGSLTRVSRILPELEEYAILAEYDDHFGYIPIDKVEPADSEETFPKSFITDVNKEYLHSFYFDALVKRSKSSIEKALSQSISREEEMAGDEMYFDWTVYCYQQESNLVMSDVGIDIIGYKYQNWIIKNIKRRGNFYEVSAICNTWDDFDTVIPEDLRPKQGGQYTLYLENDGDYLYLYIHSKDYLLASLAKTDKETVKQFQNLLNDAVVDLSRITWPRHADGTCDYEVREERRQSIGNIYRATDNLRLRSSEATSSAVIITMQKETRVKILQLGQEQTIDCIKSNWVQVEVLSGAKDRDGNPINPGTAGWCFGGFLTTAPEPEPVAAEKPSDTAPSEPEFPVLPLAAGGAAVLVIGVVVLIIVKKRKK